MDFVCPSLPLNLLTPNGADAGLRLVRKHAARMAPEGCHLATCSLYVLLVIIEISSSPCVTCLPREPSCIKQDHRSCQAFSEINLRTLAREASITLRLTELPASTCGKETASAFAPFHLIAEHARAIEDSCFGLI